MRVAVLPHYELVALIYISWWMHCPNNLAEKKDWLDQPEARC